LENFSSRVTTTLETGNYRFGLGAVVFLGNNYAAVAYWRKWHSEKSLESHPQ